jgi:N-acetyl-alpha-D-muramate 1-phosphate uridylyltransferase
MTVSPTHAMILAAGLGTRMRPLTDDRPKPLVQVAGRALIDHVLDRLEQAAVGTVVVNVHYYADMMEAHLKKRTLPHIAISDERSELLDSGGGVKNALPSLGKEPFFILNADSIWLEGSANSNLVRLARSFDPAHMDALLLLAPTATSLGYSGKGDFSLSEDGHIARRKENETCPYVYTGAAILAPGALQAFSDKVFSLNRLFDQAIANKRLYGLPIDGKWMHVGTPEAVSEAEECLEQEASPKQAKAGQ